MMNETFKWIGLILWIISGCLLAAIQIRHTGGRLQVPLSILSKPLDSIDKAIAALVGIAFFVGGICFIVSCLD